MSFDRHEILKKHYAQQIAQEYKWDAIVKEAHKYTEPAEDGDGKVGRCYLGSILSIAPSGKYYMPWTTNQTRSDETRDAAFMEAFEEAAEAAGGYITGSEGDGCDVVFEMHIEDDGQRIATFERFELSMSLEDAQGAAHQGQCDDDVAALVADPAIAAQLDVIDPDAIRAELKEYGAWNATELADDAQNRQRIVWIAASNIKEEESSK